MNNCKFSNKCLVVLGFKLYYITTVHGFTRLANPTIQDFISTTYSRQKSSIKDVLPLLHCFYEAQEPSLCNLINFRIIILDSFLNPVDYLAIGYYITSLLSVPSSDTSNVQLKIAGKIDDHRLRLLLLELSKYRTISACAVRLEIEFSKLLVESARLVASFLEQSSAVSKLMIDNMMSTDAFLSLAKALQSNSHLTTLNIKNLEPEYERKRKESDGKVIKNMFEINRSLMHFSLLRASGFAGFFIIQGLQHNKKLTHLTLCRIVNDLNATQDVAQALITMLQVNKTLTHLDLSNNVKPFVSGTYSFFESLQCNTTLVHLNLSNSGLVVTEEIAQALTTMLQVNKTLTHLDLSNNWIFQNASCIFQGLQNNTTLVYLNLSNIELKVEKDTPLAKALTTMLQENKQLKRLVLSHNPLYDEGAYCVCEGLQHNTTLVY